MNLTQAEAIASLYSELIESVDTSRIDPPSHGWGGGKFTHDQIQSMSLEDGQLTVNWSRYVGCGDYDTEQTYHRLEHLFD